MLPVNNNQKLIRFLNEDMKLQKSKSPLAQAKRDSIEISNTSKAFNKLNNFFNLGKRNRLDISDLNPKEKKEFLKMLAKLLKVGIIGYEILNVNGKPEKHYIVNEIGDQRIYGAKLYKKRISQSRFLK